MRTITILCQSPSAAVIEARLSDLLSLAGSRVRSAEWRVSGVEAIGPQSDLLHGASDSGEVLDGVSLLAVAQEVDQVVDGRFVAYDPGQRHPWLVLRAVDSTSWDAASTDAAVLDRIRAKYPRILECGDIDW